MAFIIDSRLNRDSHAPGRNSLDKPGLGRRVAGHFLEGLERVARRGTAPVNLERLKRRR